MRRVVKGWRPFWMHQGAEYILGLVLVAAGLQSTTPTWPTIAGGLIIVNTSLSGPPLGAFRAASRGQHRRLDLVVMGVVTVLAVLPVLSIDAVSRVTMVIVAAIVALLWVTTRFEPAPRRASATSEDVGRAAGRLVAKAARAARNRQG